jgi:large subunit ribosomal protein L15
MVVRREKKRRRGERTYHGSHKKWRGGGSRGGRGEAGMHKHKWSYAVKYEPEHFGKEGFARPKKVKTINLSELEKILPKLIEKKLVEKEGEMIKINLKKIGYNKLLGAGSVSKPLIVEAEAFSQSAIKKLEAAGGKAIIISSSS